MVTPQDVADAANAAGLTDKALLNAFFANAVKPIQRAAVQSQIDAENKDFAGKQTTHNANLQTLQDQLNAIQ